MCDTCVCYHYVKLAQKLDLNRFSYTVHIYKLKSRSRENPMPVVQGWEYRHKLKLKLHTSSNPNPALDRVIKLWSHSMCTIAAIYLCGESVLSISISALTLLHSWLISISLEKIHPCAGTISFCFRPPNDQQIQFFRSSQCPNIDHIVDFTIYRLCKGVSFW